MNILQMMMGACGGVTWANWDEAAESTLASDDIFVCLMENVNAGGDETGRGGGLSGADLVLSQAGNLAGATGSPPTRVFDSSDDKLTFTTAAVDALIANANNTWSIILKATNIDTSGSFIYLSGTSELIHLYSGVTRQMDCHIRQDNVDEYPVTTDNMAEATEYYIAVWADGTDCRLGFSATKPTKWSDFAANDRVLLSTNTGAFAGETFNATDRAIGYGAAYIGMDLSYIVMSKTCLIDNDL